MTAPSPDGPVERHLDEMFDRLAGTGAAGRRAMAEADDHLHAAAADGVARGLSGPDAEREAVARFGAPAEVAAELRAVHRPAWLRPAFVGLWLAGAVGMLVTGASGLVAELFGRLFGAAFVAGDAPGVTYTPARCADYFEYSPHASDCTQAAALHHWGEVVEGRVALGVLGGLALFLLWWARRATVLGGPAWTPPRGAVAFPLAGLFGLAALGLGGYGLMELAFHSTDMVGANLAAGLAALVAAAATIVAVRRRTA
jgi:hypothetical protein